jgi:transcriptional regulator with PAS, ATPase and Fis domain
LTNRQLEKAVQEGHFRADLYFRLNVITLDVPALRSRPEDIPLYCSYFMNKYRSRYNSRVSDMPPRLVEAFARHPWPGNVRQLENAVKRFLILEDLEAMLREFETSVSNGAAGEATSLKAVAANAAEQAERDAVLKALEETQWNRKQAARKLGICYKALLNKLKKWQMDNRPRSNSDPATSGSPIPRA